MIKNINVFLITIDCLRADFVSCLDKREIFTPNIDEIAKNGVLFTQAIVNGPSTPFSFPSIFTSSYPLIDPNFPKLSKSRITIAKILRDNGFKTAGFNSNPYLSKYYNYNIGFQFFDDIFSEKKIQQKAFKGFIKKYKTLYVFLRKIKKKILKVKHKLTRPYQMARTINIRLLNWVKENKGNKFVWVHYMDTHHPFLPPPKYKSRKKHKSEKIIKRNPIKVSNKQLTYIKNLYKTTIKYVDDEIGLLLEELQKLNLKDNSLFIITADHGEEFKEHGGFSHTGKLYEELIHVPLILKGPMVPKNIKINKIASLIDLFPTIIDYLGINDFNDLIGKSLLPLFMKSNKEYKREGVFSECLTKNGKINLSFNEGFRLTSYRTEDWKLIINEEMDTKELYNLVKDPNEKINACIQNPKITQFLENKVLNHKREEQALINMLKEREKISWITNKLAKINSNKF